MTNTGNFVALAAVLVSVLAHFNIVVSQDSMVAIIAGILSLYGVIHQLFINKTGQTPIGKVSGMLIK